MKNSQKGSGALIVIILIVIALVGGYYFFVQRNAQDNSDNISKIILKSFEDKNVGIAFSYPKTWVVQKWNNERMQATTNNGVGYIYYGATTINSRTSYEAFKDKSAYGAMTVLSEKEVTIGGEKAMAILFTPKIEEEKNSHYYRYNIFKGGKKYTLELRNDGPLAESDMRILDGVAATLTFTSN